MIGTKITKENLDRDLYHECAAWCNSTQQGIIEDKGDYYEVVTNPYYEDASTQSLKAELAEKEKYLTDTDWMVVKCMERGLEMKVEYAVEYVTRQEYRERIDEIRTLLA